MKAKPYIKWLIAAAVFGAIWLTWNVAYPSGTWRYKMTVEVETPEGIKTGSAVREVKVQLIPEITPETKPMVTLKGEAVVVDLGTRGVLFALLRGLKSAEHAKFLPVYIFPSKEAPLERTGLTYYSRLKSGPQEVPQALYPMLVRFQDLNDPKTAESLNLEKCTGEASNSNCVILDRLYEVFGAGVKLKSVSIQMTDERASFDMVPKLLPWILPLKGYISGEFSSGPEFYQQLDKGDFIRGLQ